MKAWLRLFRVVNLPTVPGDVLVGAAAALTVGRHSEFSGLDYVWCARLLAPVWWAAGASVLLYMFGLVQNDIMGAKTDKDRPIPNGEISMDSAWAAATVCIAAAFGCAYIGGLFDGDWTGRFCWPWCAIALVVAITVYNRSKAWWMMGFCRAEQDVHRLRRRSGPLFPRRPLGRRFALLCRYPGRTDQRFVCLRTQTTSMENGHYPYR